MAIIELRMRFTAETKKSMAANPQDDRRQAVTDLCEEIGLSFVDGYRSMGSDEIIVRVRGDIAKIPLLNAVMNGTGGFESVRSDVLVHVDEMREHRTRAQKIASRFRAPNEDEIDRMLLEEQSVATFEIRVNWARRPFAALSPTRINAASTPRRTWRLTILF